MSLLERLVKPSFTRLLDKLVGRDSIAPHEVNRSEIKRILVIRQHDQLGDFLLSMPVLRALREHFPDARIGLIARDYFADVASFVPCIDEVLVFRSSLLRWTLKRLIAFWRQLRGRWEMAVVLNTVSHSLTSDVLASVSGARYVVGSEAHLFPGCSRNSFYNVIAPLHRPPRHQTERNLDIVRVIGVDTQDMSEEIRITHNEGAFALERSATKSHPAPARLGMHLGAGKKPNRWPVKSFAGLAQMAREKYGVEIILFWGPAEYDLQREFCGLINFLPVAVEPSSLVRLASCFSKCDAMVCNDTGVMHLAAAVGVPLVAVFGPTDPTEWMPFGRNCVSIRGEQGKIENVSPETVIHELENLIGPKLKRRAADKTTF